MPRGLFLRSHKRVKTTFDTAAANKNRPIEQGEGGSLNYAQGSTGISSLRRKPVEGTTRSVRPHVFSPRHVFCHTSPTPHSDSTECCHSFYTACLFGQCVVTHACTWAEVTFTWLCHRGAVNECHKAWDVENSPHQVDLTSTLARSSTGGIFFRETLRPVQSQRRPCLLCSGTRSSATDLPLGGALLPRCSAGCGAGRHYLYP